MIKVHHLENSRSQRVLWLLEELGLDYEIVEYARDPDTMLAPAALKQVHPLGKSPVVTDGEITLAESGAIIDYLIEHYDTKRGLIPEAGSADYRHYRFWLHYAEGPPCHCW
ncbi:glutathione S-transferase [Halomonas sp. PR-M31]|uniref:glutathione S-transferase N-terminal domain-containing protein n=1 Tax=Halomonas sp. PR-M31 TaxID=1471202 RepID=UPI000B00D1E7